MPVDTPVSVSSHSPSPSVSSTTPTLASPSSTWTWLLGSVVPESVTLPSAWQPVLAEIVGASGGVVSPPPSGGTQAPRLIGWPSTKSDIVDEKDADSRECAWIPAKYSHGLEI